MLGDVDFRRIVASDHVELLRRDFRASRGTVRGQLGRHLVRIGTRLAGEPAAEPHRLYVGSRLPSGACR